jgi:hypothetical protein
MKPRIDDMHFRSMLDIIKPIVSPEQSLQSHKSIIRRASPRKTRSQGDVQVLRDIEQWLTVPQHSLLVLQAEARAQVRVQRIATEVVGRLTPESNQVIWYLSGIGNDKTSTSCTTEVLRTLLSQLMRLFPSLVTENPHYFNASKLSSLHSAKEWLDLISQLCKLLPTCFVIVEAEDVLRNEGSSSSLMGLLSTLSSRLIEAKAPVKLLLVDHTKFWAGAGTLASVIQIQREVFAPRKRWRGSPQLNASTRSRYLHRL